MIEILSSGLFTTIQDFGRNGFRNQGVPESGVMDTISAGLANALLNNHPNEALMEITMVGPRLKFKKETCFVLTGANISPELNNCPISHYKVYKASVGDVLKFGELKTGVRTYLSVKNGFKVEKVLNSCSFYRNITEKYKLQTGDIVDFDYFENNLIDSNSNLKYTKPFFEKDIIEVYQGPEFNLFSKNDIGKVLNTCFSISNENNRMGYRLNEKVLPHLLSMTTSPVLPGTIQVIPSGNIIILMKDAQTTGGYPRLFQLNEMAISILAQKKLGDKVKFKLIKV